MSYSERTFTEGEVKIYLREGDSVLMLYTAKILHADLIRFPDGRTVIKLNHVASTNFDGLGEITLEERSEE